MRTLGQGARLTSQRQPGNSVPEVHIWRIRLDRPADEVQRLLALLVQDEVCRSERLVTADLRRRFIVARGILREILARYLGVTAEAVRFEYGEHGKPLLGGNHELSQPLHFNMSHSDERALVAVTTAGPVGIDVERVRNDCACMQIACNYFSPEKYEWLKSLAPSRQSEEFFRCWTRKEAFVKATGRGLVLLGQFDVTQDGIAALPGMYPDATEAAQWSLQELAVDPGYVASLALRSHSFLLQYRET